MRIGAMKETSRWIGPKLASVLHRIYPELYADTLSCMVRAARWTEGEIQAKRDRVRRNGQLFEQDVLLIPYGNLMVDRPHKPLVLLN